MTDLLMEDFSGLPVGPLPTDFSAAEEYHYRPPEGDMGLWHEPVRGNWGPNAPWVVVEDEGAHRLLQVHDETARPLRAPRILVAGDERWRDYSVAVRLQPLNGRGAVGVLVRYQTSRHHYRIVLDGGEALKLIRVEHDSHEVLAEARFEYSGDEALALAVQVEGDHITAGIDGEAMLEARDGRYPAGRVGLFATSQVIFDSIAVTATAESHAAFVHARDAARRELDELRDRQPQPVLWRRIDTQGFGTGRQVRFGHLCGEERLDILLAQNLKLLPASDALTTVRCLTAVDLQGNVLWQFGEPAGTLDAGLVSCDVPVQIYDIDGDGHDEVLCLKNFKLHILNGRTGEVKNVRPLPRNPRREDRFSRLVGDAIIVANFRGLNRPADIVVKNRYRQIWAFDSDLNELWTREFPDWLTGHFAQPYDFDGDGRDELYIGYCLLGPDGEMRWSHDWPDHTDEIAIGAFDPDREGVQIALACGDAGFNILAADGTVLHREMLGHAQRLTAARFRDDMPGAQFYVLTYWGHAGIISFHDCRGARQFHLEPTSLGNVLNPVNWTGEPVELALLSGSARHGGMIDGHGRRVVVLPADGHPEMCCEAIDLTGDARDEIVLWDMERLWIYTQDRPPAREDVYRPLRYPHHNASNYRAEVSLPR